MQRVNLSRSVKFKMLLLYNYPCRCLESAHPVQRPPPTSLWRLQFQHDRHTQGTAVWRQARGKKGGRHVHIRLPQNGMYSETSDKGHSERGQPPNKGQAKSTHVYTLYRKSPLKEDNLSAKDKTAVSLLRGSTVHRLRIFSCLPPITYQVINFYLVCGLPWKKKVDTCAFNTVLETFNTCLLCQVSFAYTMSASLLACQVMCRA